MYKLLRFLMTGSWHECKFVIIQKGTLSSRETRGVAGMRFISRCEECGKIKYKDCI